MSLKNIRNFCILAHIDHGKSTLADRFLEITGTIEARQMKAQFLDSLELERERGITIKMAPVRMNYVFNGENYLLNLIDTPGHPDFAYEVSRAFRAVEGGILLVDATQGIQAQTLAHFEVAKKSGLRIIGVVNKIDLNPLQITSVIEETAKLISCEPEEIYKVSGKTGQGVEELLRAVIENIPSPKESEGKFTSALVFDSLYDDHKGVIANVRVFNGEFFGGMNTRLIATGEKIKIKEVGYFSPALKTALKLTVGEIGYIATGIKDPGKLQIGDTIGDKAFSGYEEPRPRVFVSFFPEDGSEYEELKKSFQKLRLNDPAIKLEPDSNEVLGRGFKAGFLGKLHFEITSQRLEKEFNVETINSFPSVSYKVKTSKGDFIIIDSPKDLSNDFMEIWEPMIDIEILIAPAYLGSVLKLSEPFRMKNVRTKTIGERILISAKMPLMELISDFDDQLKSVSHGFASFSYSVADYQKGDLVKIDVLVAKNPVIGLSRIFPKSNSEYEARKMAKKLKEFLPHQQFEQAIQIVVGTRVIARETMPALRKDVTGYLYGGDRTRKMKLWKKQKAGKKKLLNMARVAVSAKVFKELLKKE